MSDELVALTIVANAWPDVRRELHLRRNLCVHASLAVARALAKRGLDVAPTIVKAYAVVPSVGRLVEFGVTPGQTYRGRGPDAEGYDLHAIVVGHDGFADLTMDAHELVPRPVALPWESVSVDSWVVDDLFPGVPTGDAWAVGTWAAEGPWAGSGCDMALAWCIADDERPLVVRNVEQARVVSAIAAAFSTQLDAILGPAE